MLQNSNKIGDNGGRGLGEGLKVNSSLEDLFLVRHLISILICLLRVRCRQREGRGWAALTCVLQANNRIGDDGARELGEGLKVNSSLRHLELVRPLFCYFFLAMERGWAALTRVLQNSNKIGDDGGRGLGQGLKVNSSLQKLFLVRHLVLLLIRLLGGGSRERESNGWAALTRVLQANNRIGDDGARELGEGLKVNSILMTLGLVRHLVLLLFCLLRGRCREREGRGWAALTRLCCRPITESGTTVLESWARG